MVEKRHVKECIMNKKIKVLASALVAAIGLMTVMGCSNDPGGDDDNGGHWLIREQKTYIAQDGIVGDYSNSDTSYSWIAYRYGDKTNYEEEYTTTTRSSSGSGSSYSSSDSRSEYHYTRDGQTSRSTTETITKTNTETSSSVFSGISSTTATYDSASGLTSSSTTVSSGVTTAIVYSIDLLSDSDGVKTYKHTPVGSNGYSILKIQNDRTLETSYYDEHSSIMYTTTYTQPDNAEIRSKLPNFTLSSARYFPSSYSIRNSYQTAEVLPLENLSYLERLGIRVKTFYDGVLSSQTDYTYEKRNPNVNLNPVGIESNGGEFGYEVELKRWGDFWYSENGIIHIWTGTESNVVIPEQINGKPVTGIAWGAFERRYKLVSVTIPNSVTSIGGSAFGSCWSLASVTIGNSVTSIGQNAFSRCISLTSVTIPNSVTSIGQMAFWDCPLTSVTFQGTIPPDGIGNTAFDNYGLEGKYLEGGVGTYTWDDDTRTWMKQD